MSRLFASCLFSKYFPLPCGQADNRNAYVDNAKKSLASFSKYLADREFLVGELSVADFHFVRCYSRALCSFVESHAFSVSVYLSYFALCENKK